MKLTFHDCVGTVLGMCLGARSTSFTLITFGAISVPLESTTLLLALPLFAYAVLNG